ncbi:restriction endonuclease subunit S [Mannheimia haemolytica]|nr:restriction endonuclease subunit S [Mannheimia haemolytica]
MTNSIIEKLLNGAEVEWKPLGEVCEFRNGFAFKSNLFKEEGLPIIRITNIDGKNINLSDVKYFNSSDYDSDLLPYEVNKGDILLAMSGATTGKIGFYGFEITAYLNQRVGKFIPDKKVLNNKFLYHFLLSKAEDLYIMAGGGVQPNLSSNKLLKDLIIPIPPLEIQQKIVKILDKFTELEATLEAELALRKKQYQYYRETLLTFPQDLDRGGYNEITKALYHNTPVVFKTLGEMGELIRGNGLQKKDFTETGVPAIHYGQIYTYYGTETDKTISFVTPELAVKLRKVNHGDVVITNTSENLDDVGKALLYLGEEQAVTGGHATIFRPNEDILGKYFVYLTQTQFFFNEKRKLAKGTKVIDVSANDMSKITVPIPSLSEQQKIVNILDKFDSLTNSITEGLPKEIELRRKQYEYYREKLLDFPRNS